MPSVLLSPANGVLLAGLVAGALDLLYAVIAYSFVGVPPERILQSVASGWLGRAAYTGGATTAVVGALSHFAICIVAAAMYEGLSRRLRVLVERPFICGPVFGLVMFVAMNYVVVPLSAAAVRPPAGVFLWVGILVHMVLVGLPIAWAVVRLIRPMATGDNPDTV